MANSHYVVRLIRQGEITIANLCDEENLGKQIKGDGIEMNISKDHFAGNIVDVDEAIDIVRKSQIVNLIGDRIVGAVLDANLASKEAVKRVSEISFLMIYNL